MHMRHKDKIKRYVFVLLIVFISIISVSLISGRINTTRIVVMTKDGIDVSKKMHEQTEFYDYKDILKSEASFFKGSIVTDKGELKGKKLLYPLKAGSPIPKSALTSDSGAGQFAASMEKGKTIHKLTDAVNMLPPVQVGDVINIALTINAGNSEGSKNNLSTGILLANVKVHSVRETNIYVEVTLQEDLLLSTASQFGAFIYQLPGQKNPLNCREDECTTESGERVDLISKDEIFNMILNGEQLPTIEEEETPIDEAKEAAGDLLDDVVGSPDEKGGETP